MSILSIRNIYILVFFIAVAGAFSSAIAQPTYIYGLNSYYGGVFRYKSGMPTFKATDLFGTEAAIIKQTDGSRLWERMYNNPRLGLAASYFNYGDPKELGEVFSITGFIDAPFRKYNKSELRFNIGTGLVYSTVIFDQDTNPDNKAIGAKISYVLRGNVYYTTKINDHWSVNINLIFRHYSNGRMNMPNNGMNYPAAGIGVSYTPETTTYKDLEKDKSYDKKIHFSLYGATAWREVYQEDYKHKAYTASLALIKRVTWYNSILLGVDGFYYTPESIRRHFTPRGIILEVEDIDGRQAAVTLGNEMYFGKLSFLLQAGLYVYDPHKVWDPWYQRYALKYAVHKNAFVQVGLISHTRTANMVEWGIGLQL